MTIVYGLIGLFILVITIWSALDEDDFCFQATAALVAIPFILRVLMIK
jgi:ABC-type phosphate transport system permease subunit